MRNGSDGKGKRGNKQDVLQDKDERGERDTEPRAAGWDVEERKRKKKSQDDDDGNPVIVQVKTEEEEEEEKKNREAWT